MKATDLINYSALNKVMNLERGTIRADRVSEKHQNQVDELLNLVQYWLHKHSKVKKI